MRPYLSAYSENPRVAVAQEALAQTERGRFRVGKEFSLRIFCGTEGEPTFAARIREATCCEGDLLGALLLSAYLVLGLSEAILERLDARACTIGVQSVPFDLMVESLEGLFPREQLSLMDTAFGGTGLSHIFPRPSQRQAERALQFAEGGRYAYQRLPLILRNVIENGGVFKPNQPVRYVRYADVEELLQVR